MGFKRQVEDFVCVNCGAYNQGNGYTNHCRACLYSKHVDIEPGDRMNQCGGTMRPVAIDQKSGQFLVVHSCIRCGARRRCKTAPGDDFDAVLRVAAPKY